MRRHTSVKLMSLLLSAQMVFSCGVSNVLAVEPEAEKQPVLYLDMNDLSGQQIQDQNGKAYTVNGTAQQVNGPKDFGQALAFDGSTYVDLGSVFNPTKDYTIMAWVCMDENGKPTQAVIGRGRSGDGNNQLATLVKDGQLYHCVATAPNGSNSAYTEFKGGTVPAGTWTHIALTRSGNSITYYIDGEIAYESTNMADQGFVDTDLRYLLGRDEDGSGNAWDEHAFTGSMDEVRLYDTAMTQEEIRQVADLLPQHSIAQAENGAITVSFAEAPETEPTKEDFTLSCTVDGKDSVLEIQSCVYDAEKREAVLNFQPLENHSNEEKEVSISLTYQMTTVSGSFVLAASDNQSPQVSELSLSNLTPKLNEKPCVKGMLEVNYTFQDPDGDAEGETAYQWYIADAADGEYTPLQGINTKTIILIDDYEGKYVKCQVTPVDEYGNRAAEGVMSPASEAIEATEGNPLTDWFYEAQFGVSHHLLPEFVCNDAIATEDEKWDRSKQTWNDYIGEFDAEAYAANISKTGAKYVIITLGQNHAEYCAPNEVYDQYMREAGLLKEGEVNPKTVSYENDLPMKLANALEPYGIKVILYLPSNAPHSAHWDEDAQDYKITTEVFGSPRGVDAPATQNGKKILCEMVQWWSEHYGDKIAGWWFDGMWGEMLESQQDMSLPYNISTLANAAKAGNPYSILTFNQGLQPEVAFNKGTEYHDYTAGESQALNTFEGDNRWSSDSDDCQKFLFGPIGGNYIWGGWGNPGTQRTDSFLVEQRRASVEHQFVLGFDVKVNHKGEIDPDQFAQLLRVQEELSKPVRTNLAKNKPVETSTSYNEDYDGAKAVDGSSDTRWSALEGVIENNVGEYLAIDLEKQAWFDTVEVEFFKYENQLKNIPDSITIQVRNSEDEEWTTVLSKAATPELDSNGEPNVVYDLGEPVQGRYIRLLFEDGTVKNQNNIALVEVRVLECTPEVAVSGISLDRTSAELEIGGETTLQATVTPENAANKNVQWTTSNDKVATVENGKVTAVAAGTATITVKTEDGGYEASCVVTVKEKDEGGSTSGSSTTSRYTITVTQVTGGKISPSTTSVTKGSDKTFTITASEGYKISDVLVDGKSVGAVSTYTFENVKARHTITAKFEKVEEITNVGGFIDVKSNDWFAEAVQYAVDEGLMNGTSSNTFTPNGDTTRGMIVTILYRQAGSPKVESDGAAWWSDARVWAMENGISDGTNMNKEITREQLATMLYRYAELMGEDVSKTVSLSDFVDGNKVSAYAEEALQWAAAEGIVTGKTGNVIDPQAGATRAETATMLMRFCETYA